MCAPAVNKSVTFDRRFQRDLHLQSVRTWKLFSHCQKLQWTLMLKSRIKLAGLWHLTNRS